VNSWTLIKLPPDDVQVEQRVTDGEQRPGGREIFSSPVRLRRRVRACWSPPGAPEVVEAGEAGHKADQVDEVDEGGIRVGTRVQQALECQASSQE